MRYLQEFNDAVAQQDWTTVSRIWKEAAKDENPLPADAELWPFDLSLDIPSPQWIVCAANRYGSHPEAAWVALGARHHDRRMDETIERFELLSNEHGGHLGKAEQGFIDQYGNFLTRQEAWHIALENGQIRRRVGGDDANGGTLYSENLY